MCQHVDSWFAETTAYHAGQYHLIVFKSPYPSVSFFVCMCVFLHLDLGSRNHLFSLSWHSIQCNRVLSHD